MIAIFPELNACAEKGDIEKLAVLVRSYFGGEDARKPKLDIRSLLHDFGIKVNKTGSSGFVGVTLVTDTKGAFSASMLINSQLSSHEESFLLAHMLGHFLLKLQKPLAQGESKNQGIAEDISPLVRFEQAYYPDLKSQQRIRDERTADIFAACLHLPKGMFIKACEALDLDSSVANIFGVSQATVAQRKIMIAENRQAPGRGSEENPYIKMANSDARLGAFQVQAHHHRAGNPRGEKSQEKTIDLSAVNSDESGQSPKGAKNLTEEDVKIRKTKNLKRLRKLAKSLDDSVKI